MSRQIHVACLKCICSLALLLVFTIPALGQSSSTASVTGIVQDTSDARIANASIKLINAQTGTESDSKTSNDGNFTLPSVMPGSYSLQIERDGFESVRLTGITLNVGDAKALVIRMKVGSTEQTVSVDASGLTINTTDASVSTVIDRKFVENIPLNGRSFQDLISMTPGIVTQSPQSGSSLGYNGDFSVNGQRTESNFYSVDGVSANTAPGNGYGGPQAANSGSVAGTTALGTTQSLVSVDALQEFRALSATYSAEFGHSPGGQFTLLTRSGTESFHGTAYNYLRNNFFDANDWFNDYNGKPTSPLRQNDFGGTLGGPIGIPATGKELRDTFFFFSYEGLRLILPQAATAQYVPDTYMRQQAPPTLQSILNAFPTQNGVDYGTSANPSLAQFIQPYSLPSQIDSTSIRLDHTFKQSHTVFFRYSDTPSTTETRALSVVTTNPYSSSAYTVGTDDQFSNSFTNDFRFGYSTGHSSIKQVLDGFGGAVPTGLQAAMGAGTSVYAEPYFEVLIPAIGSTSISTEISENQINQWNWLDTLVFTKGKHQLKLGVDYRRVKSPINPTSPLVEGIFESASSVKNNAADITVLAQRVGAVPIFQEFAAFANDNWKLTPRLNLSLGLRWEVNPPPGEVNGNTPYTLTGDLNDPSSLSVAPRGTALWRTTWYNLAPRLGMAWTARSKEGYETVIRAGGGVFYDTADQTATQGYTGIGFFATKYLSGASFPIASSQLNFSPSTSAPYTSSTIYAFPNHLQLPYTLEWSTALEQGFGKNQTLTISYVGSNGRRLTSERYLSLSSLNSNFGTVIEFQTNNTSNYQGLQVQFQRSVGKGLHALSSYTWSHAIDFGSTYAALPAIRGNADYDVRHNWASGLSWDLPSSHTNRIVAGLVNEWGMDGRLELRTGFPLTIKGNFLVDPATGSEYYGNANLIPGRSLYLYGSQYPGGRAVNGGSHATNPAFVLPSAGSIGNAPRNYARGFGESQVNVAIRRQFPIHDSLALQFRAETFNVLNHPNFGYVDVGLTHTTFGQATNMLDSSLGTMASQYQQGGARSMQFALKLVF